MATVTGARPSGALVTTIRPRRVRPRCIRARTGEPSPVSASGPQAASTSGAPTTRRPEQTVSSPTASSTMSVSGSATTAREVAVAQTNSAGVGVRVGEDQHRAGGPFDQRRSPVGHVGERGRRAGRRHDRIGNHHQRNPKDRLQVQPAGLQPHRPCRHPTHPSAVHTAPNPERKTPGAPPPTPMIRMMPLLRKGKCWRAGGGTVDKSVDNLAAALHDAAQRRKPVVDNKLCHRGVERCPLALIPGRAPPPSPGGSIVRARMLDNIRVVDTSLAGLFDDFEVARRSAKPSPHSERAARSDFTAIHTRLRRPSAATTSRSPT